MPMTYEADTYDRFSPFAKHWIATSGIMNHCETNRCFWVSGYLGLLRPHSGQNPRRRLLPDCSGGGEPG